MVEFDGVEVVSVEYVIWVSVMMDYVVFGGGLLMVINFLVLMQVIFECVKQVGVVILVVGVGVGLMGSLWFNQSVCKILDFCDVRIYCDDKFKRNVFELGVLVEDDFVVEDLVYIWLRDLFLSE